MTTHVEAVIIDAKDFVKSSVQTMQMQSHLVCAVDKAYDSDNIDDKEVLSENCDKINVLAMLTKNNCRHERSLKALDKNKNIMQEHIEKEANDEVHILSETVISRHEKELLNEL